MPRKEILKLLSGYRKFREQYFSGDNPLFDRLTHVGQSPKTLIIGCSDSRVDPALISGAEPGDLFVVRNVANMVPPYETGGNYHGVSAAIEFAVVNLKVEHIVILGHRQCGGIRALMSSDDRGQLPDGSLSFVGRWVQIARSAKQRVLQKHGSEDFEAQCRHCEREAILTSIENLRTFPFVREAERDRGLELHGIFFDMEHGDLLEYSSQSQEFEPVLA